MYLTASGDVASIKQTGSDVTEIAPDVSRRAVVDRKYESFIYVALQFSDGCRDGADDRSIRRRCLKEEEGKRDGKEREKRLGGRSGGVCVIWQ